MGQETANTGKVVFPASTDKNFDNIQSNFTELYSGKLSGMSTATTPASGTCAVQFVMLDDAGIALAAIQSGIGYLSNAAGVMVTAGTSVATLTNGSISTLVTGQVFQWITDATGKLGVTLTAGAATYYMSIVLPNGKIITSSAIVVSA